MTDENLPVNVTLDLDTIERDEKDVKDPFTVKVNGRSLTFADPEDIDWRDLASIGQRIQDIPRIALEAEDFEYLVNQALPGWKFAKIVEGYMTYYGMADKIKDAQRRERLGI